MCFPKLNTAIILFISLITNIFFAQAQESLISADSSSCTFNSYKLDLLVKNDSLYKATILLNEAISFSKKYNLKKTEAKSYNALGEVLTRMSNFKKAENYYEKALKIYDSLGEKKGLDLSYSGLLNAYVLE